MSVIAMVMFGIIGYKDYKSGYIISFVWDAYFALIVIIVAAFVIYRRAKKTIGRMMNRSYAQNVSFHLLCNTITLSQIPAC